MRRAPCPPHYSRACRPLFQQLPSLWRLTSVTVRHCPTVGGMGEINPCHCNHTLAVTILLLQDKPQHLGPDLHDPNRARRRCQQGPPCRCPHHKDEAVNLHRVGTVTPLHTEDNSQTYACKSPATPCSNKRGGRAPFRSYQTQGTSVAQKCNTQT